MPGPSALGCRGPARLARRGVLPADRVHVRASAEQRGEQRKLRFVRRAAVDPGFRPDLSSRAGLRMVTVVGGFDLRWRAVAQLAVDPLLVEPETHAQVATPRSSSPRYGPPGVLPRFGGVLVHDRWASYWTYTNARHAICNAHILRDLAAVAEVDRYKPWADAMAALLVDAKRRCDRAREQDRTELPRGQRRHVRDRYDAILADYSSLPRHGASADPGRGTQPDRRTGPPPHLGSPRSEGAAHDGKGRGAVPPMAPATRQNTPPTPRTSNSPTPSSTSYVRSWRPADPGVGRRTGSCRSDTKHAGGSEANRTGARIAQPRGGSRLLEEYGC